MDQCLRDLYVRGIISFEEAMTRAMNPPELEKMIRDGARTGAAAAAGRSAAAPGVRRSATGTIRA